MREVSNTNITKHGFTTNQASELNDLGVTKKLDIKNHALNVLFNSSKVKSGRRLNLLLGIFIIPDNENSFLTKKMFC